MHKPFVCSLLVVLALQGAAAAQQVPPPPGFVPGGSGPGSSFDGSYTPGGGNYGSPPTGFGQGGSGFQPNYGGNQFDVPPSNGMNGYPQYGAPAQSPYQGYPQPLVPAVPATSPAPHVWGALEALYWWTKASPVPVPLVTPIGQTGNALLGDEDIEQDGRGGGRFTLGFTLDDNQNWAMELTYLFLATSTVRESVYSDGGPGSATLVIPFYDPTLPGENFTYLSRPGAFSGDATLRMREYLQSGEINLLYSGQRMSGTRLDWLGGFRWVNLQERLSLFTDSPNLAGDDIFQTYDDFQTSNNFYGGQIGLRGTYDDPRFYMTATAKVALGATVERVHTYGNTFIANNTGAYSFDGGYFTQPTNMGTQSRSRFAVVPEVGLNFGIKLSPWANFVVGYSFLYISSVARPGEQIDRVINPTQAPAISGNFPALTGPARPTLSVTDTDYWAQGVNFGLELKF